MKGNTAIERNGIRIGVMHFPYRKKPCLYVYFEDENCYHKVASFNSEETADWFIEICENFLRGLTE